MATQVVIFPFELFGSAGTGAGAQLLGDAIREVLDDTEQESRPCRADCLRDQIQIEEFSFETMEQVRSWRKSGRQAARQPLKKGEFLLWLGGNHLSVLPVLEELGRDTLVIQFDAHLDVYAFHDTTTELSHGNFLTHFETPRPRLINVGHSDLFLTPKEIAETFEAVHPAEKVALDLEQVAAELAVRAKAARRVWIDIDCDAIDAAAMPAVQLPMPFGLPPHALLKLLDAAWAGKVIGLSVSEFDPGRDVRDAGLNLLGWLLEFVLLRVHEN